MLLHTITSKCTCITVLEHWEYFTGNINNQYII